VAIFGPRRDRVAAATIDHGASPGTATVDPFAGDDVPSSVAPIELTPLTPVKEIRIPPLEIQRLSVPALSPGRNH
jgi:hypothetical protein